MKARMDLLEAAKALDPAQHLKRLVMGTFEYSRDLEKFGKQMTMFPRREGKGRTAMETLERDGYYQYSLQFSKAAYDERKRAEYIGHPSVQVEKLNEAFKAIGLSIAPYGISGFTVSLQTINRETGGPLSISNFGGIDRRDCDKPELVCAAIMRCVMQLFEHEIQELFYIAELWPDPHGPYRRSFL